MTVESLGRAYDLYRRTATSRSAILLLLANLIPLVGVLFFDWSLLTILVLYWLENGIVGFWNVPKIIMARGSMIPRLPDLPESAALAASRTPEQAASLQAQWREARLAQEALREAASPSAEAAERAAGGRGTPPPTISVSPPSGTRVLGRRAAARLAAIPRTGLAIFFLFHYGMFWLVHGIFVFALPTFAGGALGGGLLGGGLFGGGTFGDGTFGGGSLGDPFGGVGGSNICLDPSGFPVECAGGAFGEVIWSSVLIGAVALFLSHGASFFLNYIGRGEYLTATPGGQMGRVYGRVVILHLTIIFGSFVVAFLGAPIGALLVLVVLKTAFDLGLHLRERRSAGPLIGTAASSG